MKAAKECYECLRRLVYQAAGLATTDERIKTRAIEESLKLLSDEFSVDKISIVIAARIHNLVKEITGNPDPYLEMKNREMAFARELMGQVTPVDRSSFANCLEFAARGNTLDFFRPLEAIKEEMKRQVDFVIDDSKRFELRLKQAEKVLYLADNAGELFFDLPLVNWLRQSTRVVYVVKAAPVQDDITLDDIRRARLESELGEVMTTGTATPGIDFSQASAQFKHEFETADLIFAKGMGYYESLTELPAEGKVFYCLRAKCQPVADSLKVPLGSYVAMLC